ncbi:MAG TPA: rRNA adenine N(6)-methyltransferase family protein [Candidatus Dormibacteraeota bacterium]|nr:rRNA adenine N(6)-methyltransferase family protein [Candidatus Dormibacteraeota bacterium]
MAGRRWRPAGPPRGQHFLGDAAVAATVVESADLHGSDLVLEFGAGYGRLTEHLAHHAGRVIAIELDTRLAARLDARFRERPNVTVVHGDALAVPLPRQPFKVVSNPPFHLTSALLHRMLDDPDLPLQRADLVVEWGAALALTGVFGPAHKARRWRPSYEFLLLRRLAADAFTPAPPRPAALVSIRRRQ